MSIYVTFNIKPFEAPKFTEWYFSCKRKNIEVVPYITAAIRYYAATQDFLNIGSVIKESDVEQKRIGIYVRKTDDVVAWIAKLKREHIKALYMVTYILENSILLTTEEQPMPKSIELEILVNNVLLKGKTSIYSAAPEVNTKEQLVEVDNKIQKKEFNGIMADFPEIKQQENKGDINLLQHAGFKGLT